jgi:hypothetical protein
MSRSFDLYGTTDARTSRPCSHVRYSIVHSATADRSPATSASRRCPTRAAVWTAIRRISRAGSPRARTTTIQLAWLWLRYQPGSDLAEWFRKRVGTLAGHTRRIAIVALARKLLIALWHYVETGVVPDSGCMSSLDHLTSTLRSWYRLWCRGLAYP